jgi:fructoselysine-6-P-deglycase FrlB-like protein
VEILSDPVDYLTEENYRPPWLEDDVTELTLRGVEANKKKLIQIGVELSKAERYYLVGSGGSYSVQFPFKYIAEKWTDIPVHSFSGWEFLETRPVIIDEHSACIFISQSGKTKEIVEALKWVSDKGSITFGLSQKEGSEILKLSDHGFAWKGRSVTLGKLSSLYYIFGSIFREKGYQIGEQMIQIADKLPTILPSMIPEAKKGAKKLGLELKDCHEMYVLGGDVNWGLTYQFALCTLMEMCWVHATAIKYSEFRHGALELFTEGEVAVFLRGRSSMRDLEDKILEFAKGNGVKCIVYDSQDLEVDNLMTPFTLFMELEWLSYYLSLAKNRRMGHWRFYDKVKF